LSCVRELVKMGLAILLFIGAITLGFFYLRRQMSYWKRRDVPALEASYIFGNLEGVGQTVHLAHVLQKVYESFKDNFKLAGLYMFQSPRLVLIDLELIKTVLIKDFHYFTDRGVYNNEEDDPLSAHLFAIEGEISLTDFSNSKFLNPNFPLNQIRRKVEEPSPQAQCDLHERENEVDVPDSRGLLDRLGQLD
jgi:hypothetical protein